MKVWDTLFIEQCWTIILEIRMKMLTVREWTILVFILFSYLNFFLIFKTFRHEKSTVSGCGEKVGGTIEAAG